MFRRMMVLAALVLPAMLWAPRALSEEAKQPVQVAIDAKLYELYSGKYVLRPGLVITMTHQGSRLFSQATGQPSFELFPSSDRDFFARVAPIGVSFVVDAQGAVTALVVHQGGRDLKAPRASEKTAASLSAQIEAIDAAASAEYAKHPLGSLTIGLVSGKALLWTKSYGYADIEKKTLADKDTIYRIGSVTKMFTVLMMEQLAEAGTLHLSDPVERYFPEVKAVQGGLPNAPPITLFELATHTSGMQREPADLSKYLRGPVASWEDTLIAALAQTSYGGEPGVRFAYSNIGYATLGAALARAAKTKYLDYVQQHIFAPLGMSHTWFDQDAAMGTHLSKGYIVNEGTPDPTIPQQELLSGRGYKIPNGAVFTTVGDLARFASFLLGEGPDTVLKASALRKYQTQTAVAADIQLQSGYGLAGQVAQRPGYVAFGHGGSVAGWETAFEMNRDQSLGVIVLTNAAGNGAPEVNRLAFEILDLLAR